MKTLSRIFDFTDKCFGGCFGRAAERADHEILSRHIIQLNQKESTLEIIRQSAACLKEITRYQIFSFAVKTLETTQVWVDPEAGDTRLAETIQKEFRISEDQTCLIQPIYPGKKPGPMPCMEGLVSYTFCSREFYARIYLVPGRHMQPYHDEIAKMVLKSTATAIATQLKLMRLSDAATMDPLTGCYNRREMERQVRAHVGHAKRHHSVLSIFMFDLDHFKKVNDRFGHPAGDQVLKSVAKLASQDMRREDTLFRYGGEEFVGLLPGTGKTTAIEIATRLCERIAASPVRYQNQCINVSASFGVVCFDPLKMDEKTLIQAADEMLYRAKENGRNQVMPGMLKILPEAGKNLSGPRIHFI